jgi:hypothetical protein
MARSAATKGIGSIRPPTSSTLCSRAKGAIYEITCAEDKKRAEAAIEAFMMSLGRSDLRRWPRSLMRGTPCSPYTTTPPSTTGVIMHEEPHRVRTCAPVRARKDITKVLRLAAGEFGDDLQADGGSQGVVAKANRRSTGSVGEGRSDVQ